MNKQNVSFIQKSKFYGFIYQVIGMEKRPTNVRLMHFNKLECEITV